MQGLDPLIAKFDRLAEQITEAKQELPKQLVEWQRVDMRRQYPNIAASESGDDTIASTEIWPRSRMQQARPHKAAPAQAGPRVYLGGGRVHSARPILRQELYQKLVERMTELVRKAMKWP